MPPVTNRSRAHELEKENEQMAARLRELKNSLRQRKEARGSGVIWRSGQRGNGICSHVSPRRPSGNKPNSIKSRRSSNANSEARSKSTIKPRPSAPRERTIPEPPARSVEILPGPPAMEAQSPSVSTHKASDSGIGCGDTYNEAESHASFLEALNEWRLGRATEAVEQIQTDSTEPRGLLLQGSYNEEESAASFRDAVAAWRSGSASGGRPSTSACGAAQTEARPSTAVEITFNSERKLSFVEKMMLKKARDGRSSTQPPQDDGPATVVDSELPSKSPATVADSPRLLTPTEIVMSVTDLESESQPAADNEEAVVMCYNVDEPEDAGEDTCRQQTVETKGADDARDGIEWCTPIAITPEYSENECTSPDEKSAPIDLTVSIETILSRSSSRGGPSRGKKNETPDPHGRHVITPSLMDDFEEMERSFTEA